MASQRTLPYFPTLVKRYDTRSRGIYGRAALPGRKHHGPGKPAQPGDTRRTSGARAARLLEIHRERVQDQTVDMFSGDKYTPGSLGAAVKTTRFKSRLMSATEP